MSTGIRSESADGPRPDGAHLDEDAECLEDPVHCGDARHQHDAHQAHTTTPGASDATKPPPAADVAKAATVETSQT